MSRRELRLGCLPMDAGDAALVVLSELCPRARLITIDDDFRRYRRVRHQVIPLVILGRA